jgi:hypothetical protein
MENEVEQQEQQESCGKDTVRANVRFNIKEHAQLLKDERTRGMSIPALLKEAYFRGRPTAIIMSQEDQKTVMTELLRQGNNLNQIARKLNAGIANGLQQEIEAIRRSLNALAALITGKVLKPRT